MKRDTRSTYPLNSSFLSFEKDLETILRALFVESQPHSDNLKRLLVINTKDCLDDLENPDYQKIVKEMTLAKLVQHGYVKIKPKINMPEHEEQKAYIIISCDNFTPNATNPQFRDFANSMRGKSPEQAFQEQGFDFSSFKGMMK
jgi:hypothetical protein